MLDYPFGICTDLRIRTNLSRNDIECKCALIKFSGMHSIRKLILELFKIESERIYIPLATDIFLPEK